MARGQRATNGETRVSPNGYHYTKTSEGWELTHRLLAEKKLGRKLQPNERVKFIDGNRQNITEDNVEVFEVKRGRTNRRRAQLQARINELQAQLDDLDREEAS